MLDLPLKISANRLNITRLTALQLPFFILVDEAFFRILFEYFCELDRKKIGNMLEYFSVTIGDLRGTHNIEISI